MKRKFRKISSLEGWVLLFTGLFVAGTLLWFFVTKPSGGIGFVETGPAVTQAEPRPEPEAPGMLEGEVLDLNTASPGDLTRLPGIGEKRAEEIVAFREANGGFTKVEQLLEIKGIGDKTLEKLRPYVTVGAVSQEEGGTYGTDSGG